MDLVTPTTINGTVVNQPPRRKTNAELRAREYLTDQEVSRLIEAAGDNRYGHRDATMVLLAYRHGFRVSELVGLRWDALDFNAGRLHVNRAKNGSASVHPLSGRELRALRAEWELKIAEDQVRSWQWHLEMRHNKYKRKIETDTNHMTRSILHEIDVKNINPEEALNTYHKLIAGKIE